MKREKTVANNDTSGSAVAIRFAERMSRIRESGVRELFDEGQRIPGSIDLSIGQADFDVPDPVKEATIRAVEENCGRYSVSQGFPELVDAVRRHLQGGPGLPGDDALMITSGASGAIHLALLALAGPGDESCYRILTSSFTRASSISSARHRCSTTSILTSTFERGKSRNGLPIARVW